tara:strand:+ start:410 stop:556 length:147 start_codon:yes stop_codon:yes gene_type:complete
MTVATEVAVELTPFLAEAEAEVLVQSVAIAEIPQAVVTFKVVVMAGKV